MAIKKKYSFNIFTGTFDKVLDTTNIENLLASNVDFTLYEKINFSNASTGQITIPNGATIDADAFGQTGRVIVSLADTNDKPTYESAKGSSEEIITATIDLLGEVTLSENYVGDLIIIYNVDISKENFISLSQSIKDREISLVDTELKYAKEIRNSTIVGFISTNVQNFLQELVNKVLFNRIVVRQASQLLNIDSSKTYFIDVKIDIGSLQIQVPSTGLVIDGHDYLISNIHSSVDNHIIFINKVGEYAGNVKIKNVEIYHTGLNSKIFDLDNQGNNSAIEFFSTNLGRFSSLTPSLGDLSGYRQFRTSDVAIIRIADGLTFSETWLGGFRVFDTILLSIPANVTVFKEGTNLVFEGSSTGDLNGLSIDNTSTVFDFQDSNFLRDEGFSLNGARFNLSSIPIPNMTLQSTKRFFRNCSGVQNTFPGGIMTFTTENATPLVVGQQAKANGTTVYTKMVYFSNLGNNAFTYLSQVPKDFIITGQIIVDSGANNELNLIIRKFDNNLGVFVDEAVFSRDVSNSIGGTDVADFDPYVSVTLNQNDRIEIWLRNNTAATAATIQQGSFLVINIR